MSEPDINKDGFISKYEAFPYLIDKLRIFPRAFISVYIYVFYIVVEWFMTIPEPNMAQAGLVSVITGAGAAWFGLYVNSGSAKTDKIVVQTNTDLKGMESSYTKDSGSSRY